MKKLTPIHLLISLLLIFMLSTVISAQLNTSIRAIAWNNDDSLIAIARANDIIEIRNISEQTARTITFDSQPLSLDWSPVDNNVLVVSFRTGSPQVITLTADDVSTRRLLAGMFVTQAEWNADGTRLALMGQSDTSQPNTHSIQVWDTQTWESLPLTFSDDFTIGDIAWSTQTLDHILLTGVLNGYGARIALWDSASSEILWSIEAQDEGVMSLAWSPQENVFATLMNDVDGFIVRLHDGDNGQVITTLPISYDAFTGQIAWMPSPYLIISTTGKIDVWDVDMLEIIETLSSDAIDVRFALNADGSQVAYEVGNGEVVIMNLSTAP